MEYLLFFMEIELLSFFLFCVQMDHGELPHSSSILFWNIDAFCLDDEITVNFTARVYLVACGCFWLGMRLFGEEPYILYCKDLGYFEGVYITL